MTTELLPGKDAELVELALQGRQEAFAELYNRYFPRVYDFIHRMTRNSEEAADVTQETFLRAMESLEQLKKASSFKSWIFSIAHHSALRRLDRQTRFVPAAAMGADRSEETADPLLQQVDPDRLVDPEQASEAQDMANLVWEAAASLEPRQYALLDLHVRQGLGSAEIAEVMGVSKVNASVMLNRMRKAVEEAIGSFLLARRGSKDCAELQSIIAPATIPPVTPELRKGIDRHVRGCDICSETRKRILSPVEILGAFAPVPVPIGLQEEVWGTIEPRWEDASTSLQTGDGVGEPPAGRGLRARDWASVHWRRMALLLGSGAAAVIVAFILLAWSPWSGSGDEAPSSLGNGAPTRETGTPDPDQLGGPVPLMPTATRPLAADSTKPPATEQIVLATPSLPTVTQGVPPTEPFAEATGTSSPVPTPKPQIVLATPSLPTVTQEVPPTEPFSLATATFSPMPTATPDTTPPVVQGLSSDATEVYTTNCQPGLEPRQVAIAATVSDGSSISSVVLFYRAPEEALMSADMGDTNVYSATIGPFTSGGQLVYWVEATDLAGNTARTNEQTLDVVQCVL